MQVFSSPGPVLDFGQLPGQVLAYGKSKNALMRHGDVRRQSVVGRVIQGGLCRTRRNGPGIRSGVSG